MTAIVGMLRTDGIAVDPAWMQRASSTPASDAAQHYCEGPIAILGRIGPSASPSAEAAAPAIVVAFDGHIANLDDVDRELGYADGRASRDTTSVIAVAYRRWGAECFARLDGPYSIAVWEPATRRLVLARDPQGIKPLFYTEQGGALLFASDFHLFTGAAARITARLSPAAAHEFLAFLYVPPPLTMLDDVWQLGQGEVLTVDGAQRRVSQAGPPPPPARHTAGPEGPYDPEAAIDELDDALHAAIRRRVPPSGQCGLFLSGGVDSGLLAAIAGRLIQDRLIAYTVRFRDPRLDESARASAIAGHLGIKHEILDFTADECLDAFPRFIEALDNPFGDPASLHTLRAFEVVRETATTVLDGDGADGLFGGPPSPDVARALRLTGWWPARTRAVVRALLAQLPGARWQEYAELLDYEDRAEPLMSWNAWKGRAHRRLTGHRYPFARTEFYRIVARYPVRDVRAQYTDVRRLFGTYGMLPRVVRLGAATGVHAAFPYKDRQVTQVVRRLPPAARYADGHTKVLLRQVLARYIPATIWQAPKMTFSAPLDDVLGAGNHALVSRYVTPARAARHGLYRADVAQMTAARYRHGTTRLRDKIWALILLEAWLDRHPTIAL